MCHDTALFSDICDTKLITSVATRVKTTLGFWINIIHEMLDYSVENKVSQYFTCNGQERHSMVIVTHFCFIYSCAGAWSVHIWNLEGQSTPPNLDKTLCSSFTSLDLQNLKTSDGRESIPGDFPDDSCFSEMSSSSCVGLCDSSGSSGSCAMDSVVSFSITDVVFKTDSKWLIQRLRISALSVSRVSPLADRTGFEPHWRTKDCFDSCIKQFGTLAICRIL